MRYLQRVLLLSTLALFGATGCAGLGTGAEKAQRIADITGITVRDVVGNDVADIGQAGKDYCAGGGETQEGLQPESRAFVRERIGCNVPTGGWPADAPEGAVDAIRKICDGGDELCEAATAIDWQDE